MAASNEPKLRIIVKKKKGGHGHHGGAWKVAYADFVTAMMALFIVLWLLAVSTPQAKKDIARYFREPGVFKGGHAAMVPGPGGPKLLEPPMDPVGPSGSPRLGESRDPLQAEANALKAELDRSLRNDPVLAQMRKQVIITVTPEGILIDLIDRERGRGLMFDLSSAELKPALVRLLRSLAVPLKRMDNPLYIGGHTDARAFVGSNRTNWELSYERAANARRVLEQCGLGERVQRVIAHGSSQPLNPSDPLAAENRRLSILALRKPPLPASR